MSAKSKISCPESGTAPMDWSPAGNLVVNRCPPENEKNVQPQAVLIRTGWDDPQRHERDNRMKVKNKSKQPAHRRGTKSTELLKTTTRARQNTVTAHKDFSRVPKSEWSEIPVGTESEVRGPRRANKQPVKGLPNNGRRRSPSARTMGSTELGKRTFAGGKTKPKGSSARKSPAKLRGRPT
jgi:hypothetical protein